MKRKYLPTAEEAGGCPEGFVIDQSAAHALCIKKRPNEVYIGTTGANIGHFYKTDLKNYKLYQNQQPTYRPGYFDRYLHVGNEEPIFIQDASNPTQAILNPLYGKSGYTNYDHRDGGNVEVAFVCSYCGGSLSWRNYFIIWERSECPPGWHIPGRDSIYSDNGTCSFDAALVRQAYEGVIDWGGWAKNFLGTDTLALGWPYSLDMIHSDVQPGEWCTPDCKAPNDSRCPNVPACPDPIPPSNGGSTDCKFPQTDLYTLSASFSSSLVMGAALFGNENQTLAGLPIPAASIPSILTAVSDSTARFVSPNLTSYLPLDQQYTTPFISGIINGALATNFRLSEDVWKYFFVGAAANFFTSEVYSVLNLANC
jgi:hypothetical protein